MHTIIVTPVGIKAYSDKKDGTRQINCPDQLDPGEMQDMESMPSARCRESASAEGRVKKKMNEDENARAGSLLEMPGADVEDHGPGGAFGEESGPGQVPGLFCLLTGVCWVDRGRAETGSCWPFAEL
jgi:hypothetical protein